MSNFALLFISLIILLSSLSESFEFIVHNEESLLVLCFVAFIFVRELERHCRTKERKRYTGRDLKGESSRELSMQ
jgi:hypothetical protein